MPDLTEEEVPKIAPRQAKYSELKFSNPKPQLADVRVLTSEELPAASYRALVGIEGHLKVISGNLSCLLIAFVAAVFLGGIFLLF